MPPDSARAHAPRRYESHLWPSASLLERYAKKRRNRIDIFVATSGKIEDHDFVGADAPLLTQIEQCGNRMRRFERGDDAFAAAERGEAPQGVGVTGSGILRAAAI